MKNLIEIDGEKAVIAFDPEIQMLRGEFVGLNGGADFYAESVRDLIVEGRRSLAFYLEMCRDARAKAESPVGRAAWRLAIRAT